MKTITVNLYSFSELSNTAKERALDRLSDINLDYNWWDGIYEDASLIDLLITEFDIDSSSINGVFNNSACAVAQNILNSHGESCDTYQTALEFMDEWQPVFNDYTDETSEDYESREAGDKLLQIEDNFLSSLLMNYLNILKEEYFYRASKEAIIETIEANEYLFTEDGKMY